LHTAIHNPDLNNIFVISIIRILFAEDEDFERISFVNILKNVGYHAGVSDHRPLAKNWTLSNISQSPATLASFVGRRPAPLTAFRLPTHATPESIPLAGRPILYLPRNTQPFNALPYNAAGDRVDES
jgi:hypothetical protein